MTQNHSVPDPLPRRYHNPMPSTAADVPAITSILCEQCGYTLDGLPPESRCPECGKPVIESLSGDGRSPAEWEAARRNPQNFLRTTWRVIVSPSAFFRATTTRGPIRPAEIFARMQWCIASILFATAGWIHWFGVMFNDTFGGMLPFFAWLALFVLTFAALFGTTRLAANLSAWEGRYRGMRLPKPVVLRGLYYHAAHYLPVSLMALASTGGYAFLYHRYPFAYASFITYYLYSLSGEVILAAVYLFWTYWAAMRNMMYANR